MLKRIGQIFLLVVFLTSCSVEKNINKDNTLTEGERADGWVLLLDKNNYLLRYKSLLKIV
jgi:hypothetical protein